MGRGHNGRITSGLGENATIGFYNWIPIWVSRSDRNNKMTNVHRCIVQCSVYIYCITLFWKTFGKVPWTLDKFIKSCANPRLILKLVRYISVYISSNFTFRRKVIGISSERIEIILALNRAKENLLIEYYLT